MSKISSLRKGKNSDHSALHSKPPTFFPPPISFELVNEISQHSLNFNGELIELFVFFVGKETEILSEQEVVLEFAGRSGGDMQETLELGIATFTASPLRYWPRSKPNIGGSG